MKIHLVDGTYELFRSFYGAPAARDPGGREVGGTRGWLRSLYSLLQQEDVTHVACAFDTVIESFRNDLFDGYKTGQGIPPDLWLQFPLGERAASALGVVVWPMHEFEADDALATAAARFARDPAVQQVVLCTPDKDLAQCVRSDRVIQRDRKARKDYDAAAVRARYDVDPGSIPDWLALVGDSADGIPGIPRWGKKSAALLLQRYVHLEAIPADEKDWEVEVRGAASLARELREKRPEASLYKRLATLREDVPLAEGVDDLEWRGVNDEALRELCDEIDDLGFYERVVGG